MRKQDVNQEGKATLHRQEAQKVPVVNLQRFERHCYKRRRLFGAWEVFIVRVEPSLVEIALAVFKFVITTE
jgi:hypothetical protein